jgi:hypothetical protein
MAAGWLSKQRERETLAGFSLGLPSFPSMPTANDKRKRFPPDPFGLREKIQVDLLPPLGRFAEKEKRKGNNESRVFVFEYKFKFEFV